MRIGKIKRWDKVGLLLTIVISLAALVMFFFRLGEASAPKWLSSFGQLLTIAGIFQLEVSGLFDRVIAGVADEEKYPYGPPSHITREIISDPDRPITMILEGVLFFQLRTGFWFIVIGTLAQLGATWL